MSEPKGQNNRKKRKEIESLSGKGFKVWIIFFDWGESRAREERMSTEITNPTIDIPTKLKLLKKKYEEISEDISSTKDVKKMIDRLIQQFPLHPNWEQKLSDQFSKFDACCKNEPTDFRSIRKELTEIIQSLSLLTSEANLDKFQALSDREWEIIEGKKKAHLECRRVSYEIFLRLDELKHDPRICLFLAIFPENAVLSKRFLIYWWIGEGLVPNEEEGERVFEELLDLEILTPHRTDKCPTVSKCKVFPWMRYMLISEAKKEKLLNLKGRKPRFDQTRSRRACLIAGDHTDLTNLNESVLEELRTIFNVNARDLDFPHQWLAKLNRLGVLQLGRWQVSPTHHIELRDESFLTGLKTQKYLKYLSLRGISRISSLPESIRELVSLLILDLKACHNLETLPEAIASLKKLTHLDVSDCYLLESLPKGLHNLTSLQVLKGFIIGNSFKTPFRIEHLPSLTNLKRLSIHIGSEATKETMEFEKLEKLKELECLKISWGKAVIAEEYSLSFPPGLKQLDLEGIPHKKKPKWLKPSKLRSLEKLYIKGGKLMDLLEGEERWNEVKYLVIKYTNMKKVEEDILKIFPSFQYMKWVNKDEQESDPYEWYRR